MDTRNIDREAAEMYARWFRALADPTRILILNLLATRRTPMSVGAIRTELSMGQSTVSHHLKILYDVGFVVRQRQGTNMLYEVNKDYLTKFPTAADLVMGKVPRYTVPRIPAPWLRQAEGDSA